MSNKVLQFNYLKVKNFFSYKEANLNLNDKGLIAVSGFNKANKKSNGAGKSALIAEALVFALFGETIRKVSITKIPNRFTKEQCIVEVNFELGGHSYTVKRTRRPDSLSLFVDSVLTSEDKAQGDSRDTTAKIKDIIKMDFDEFVNSILFGQNIQKYFFLLTDGKQKDMIDNIIEILIFETWKESAKRRKELYEAKEREKNNRIAEITTLISLSSSRIKEIEQKEIDYTAVKNEDSDIIIGSLNIKIADMTKVIQVQELRRVSVDIENLKALKSKELKFVDGIGKLTSLMSSLKQVVNRSAALPLQDGVLLLNAPTNSDSIIDLETHKTELNNKVIDFQSKILTNTTILNSQMQKIKSVEALSNCDCPTCGRLVDDTCLAKVKEEYVKIVQDIKKEAESLERQINMINDDTTITDNAISDRKNQKLFDEIIAAQNDSKKYEDMKEVLSTQLIDLQRNIKEINGKIDFNNALNMEIASSKATLSSHIQQLSSVMKEKENKTKDDNPFTELKHKEAVLIGKYNTEINQIQVDIDDIKKHIMAAAYWQKGFGDKEGVKSYIYERVFPYLNERCNHYLSLLSNGEIIAEIGLDDKDRFIVKTENAMGADVYGGNSGGEKRRIDLAVMFALHDLVASRKYKSNILILDEIFDSLDIHGIDTAMAVLEDLSSDYDSIFVISHSDMQEYFDNHLYILKDGKTSYISDTLEAA